MYPVNPFSPDEEQINSPDSEVPVVQSESDAAISEKQTDRQIDEILPVNAPPRDKAQLWSQLNIREWITAAAALGATIAAVTSVAIAWLTYGQLNAQRDIMQNQLNSMNNSGLDTHNLAVATKDFSAAMKSEADSTAELVGTGKASAVAANSAASAASKQAATDREEFLAQEDARRPRVYIASFLPITPITFDHEGAHLTISFQLKNAGEGDAEFAFPFAEFYMRDFDASHMVDRRNEFCNSIKKRKLAPFAYGSSIAKDQQIGENEPMIMSPGDVKKWTTDPIMSKYVPNVSGCIDYLYRGQHHQTTFNFEVDRRAATQSGFDRIDPTKGPIPQNDIALMIHPALQGGSN